jgi:hypothetical protein
LLASAASGDLICCGVFEDFGVAAADDCLTAAGFGVDVFAVGVLVFDTDGLAFNGFGIGGFSTEN